MASLADTESDSEQRLPAGGAFVTTHWSIVLSAQDKSAAGSMEALENLCRAYWRPLYAYVRRCGKSPVDAEDLTQAFFAQLLTKEWLATASREKGRFRSFLLTALKRFMANDWDRSHALKRGGFALMIPMDLDLAESQYSTAPEETSRPDLLYDRQWAQALLERTVAALKKEYLATGRASLFEHLEHCLAKNESALSYREIAERLNLSDAAVKMAVHRLRARFRELLREEVAQTVCSSDDAEDEIKHLFSVF